MGRWWHESHWGKRHWASAYIRAESRIARRLLCADCLLHGGQDVAAMAELARVVLSADSMFGLGVVGVVAVHAAVGRMAGGHFVLCGAGLAVSHVVFV